MDVVGFPANASEAPICVVNHTSFLDIFIMYACKRFSFIAKKEIKKIPFGKQITKAGQTVFVDRTNKESSQNVKAVIMERCRQRKRKASDSPGAPKWPTIVMFPESTCTNGTALITFKKGAFIPAAPVQPITIKYHWSTCDPCKVYGGGPGIGTLLFRLLTSLHNSATVHFLDVYNPDDDEKKDALLYAENVRVAMAKSLKVAVTNHSYADVQLLLQAKKAHIRRRSLKKMNIEMQTLTNILDAKCSAENFRFFLKEFHTAAGKTGEITKDQFFQVLKMPKNQITERVFQLFDIDSDGVLQFKEFMAGIALLYFNNDRDVLAEIITSKNDESGNFYFDKNEIKRFATFRKMGRVSFEIPTMSNVRGAEEEVEEDSFRSISLRSANSAEEEASAGSASDAKSGSISHGGDSGGGEDDNKVWWTPDELYKYIQENPDDFKWLNPLKENTSGNTRSFGDTRSFE